MRTVSTVRVAARPGLIGLRFTRNEIDGTRSALSDHPLSEDATDSAELARRWQVLGDRQARELLCQRFLPLARRLARHYRTSNEPFEDLVQVASVGLLGAIDRFDPARPELRRLRRSDDPR